jgi:uncharacterized protein YidB (DUF937 family)
MTEGLTNMLGGLLKGNSANIISSVLKVAQSQGGLSSLVEKFTHQDSPTASAAASWVGTGDNQAVSGDEVEQAVGADTVNQVAQDAGVSPTEAKDGLAAALPQLIDKLSPNGKLDLGSLGKLLG